MNTNFTSWYPIKHPQSIGGLRPSLRFIFHWNSHHFFRIRCSNLHISPKEMTPALDIQENSFLSSIWQKDGLNLSNKKLFSRDWNDMNFWNFGNIAWTLKINSLLHENYLSFCQRLLSFVNCNLSISPMDSVHCKVSTPK